MGLYSYLSIRPFDICDDKGDVNPLLMTLFRERDKRVVKMTLREAEKYGYAAAEDDQKDEEMTLVHYACPAFVAKDRLDMMGFTREVAEAAFNAGRRAAILPGPTVNEWMGGLREIKDRNLSVTLLADQICGDYSPLLREMLSTTMYGFPGTEDEFPGTEIRYFLRLVLEVCRDDDQLVYDLTELASDEEFDFDFRWTEYAQLRLAEQFPDAGPVIILTEGSSDGWVIERSLKLLYPHIGDCFHFLDLKQSRLGGGTGHWRTSLELSRARAYSIG